MIESFFDVMNSFLERIQILESTPGRIPGDKVYRDVLIRVFTSILELSVIAGDMKAGGLMSKFGARNPLQTITDNLENWFHALGGRGEQNLKDSYNNLNQNIQRLESATLFFTLRQTQETKMQVIQGRQENLRIHATVNANLRYTRQTLQVGYENQQVIKETARGVHELTKNWANYVTRMEPSAKGKDFRDAAKTEPKKERDAGMRSSAALAYIKKKLTLFGKFELQYEKLRDSFVPDTFQWVKDELKHKAFLEDTHNILWVHGPTGMGKSSFAYFAISNLRERYQNESKSSVAYFFFSKDDDKLRSTKKMLRSIVIQIATSNPQIREEVAAKVKKKEHELKQEKGGESIWETLSSKVGQSSEAKLILVIDGFDETDLSHRKILTYFLRDIWKKNLRIKVLLTSISCSADVLADKPKRESRNEPTQEPQMDPAQRSECDSIQDSESESAQVSEDESEQETDEEDFDPLLET